MGRPKIRTGLPEGQWRLCNRCARETAITDFQMSTRGILHKCCPRCVKRAIDYIATEGTYEKKEEV